MGNEEMVDVAVSVGFSLIGLILQYMRTAGVDEDVIEANWALTKMEYLKRPSEDLPEVPE